MEISRKLILAKYPENQKFAPAKICSRENLTIKVWQESSRIEPFWGVSDRQISANREIRLFAKLIFYSISNS